MNRRKFTQEYVEVKSKLLMVNGRSSDYISPSFINGCFGTCKYCYVHRHNPNKVKIANNVDSILQALEEQIKCLPIKISPHAQLIVDCKIIILLFKYCQNSN